MPSVSWLSVAPVKGLALQHPPEVILEKHGVTENRRFYLVREDGRRFGLTLYGPLVQVAAEYDAASERLTLRFPDGEEVTGEVQTGGPVATDFYGRSVPGHVVEGPWAAALSEFTGKRLVLVRSDEPGAGVDRSRGGVSLISDGSLAELGRHARADSAVDGRRFRMLVGVGGCEPHEEDGWPGRRLRIGDAEARILGTVGRCMITTRNPDTGEVDLDTLRVIKGYRGQNPDTRELDFGIYGEVVSPGRVRVGDPVEPL